MLKYLSYCYSIEQDRITMYGLDDKGKRTKLVTLDVEGIGKKDTKEIHNIVKDIMCTLGVSDKYF